jgi:hypothetical protein
MVYNLRSYRNNRLDTATETIVWINMIDTLKGTTHGTEAL